MTYEEFLAHANIHAVGSETDDNSYVVRLNNSDEFSRVFTLLDTLVKKQEIDLDWENSVLDSDTTVYQYMSDEFDITLRADFVADDYTITLVEAQN